MSTPATNFLFGSSAAPEWKRELNERLAAARARRTREKVEQAALPALNRFAGHPQSRISELAARVAARYAKAPSYSEMLTQDEQVVKQQREHADLGSVEEQRSLLTQTPCSVLPPADQASPAARSGDAVSDSCEAFQPEWNPAPYDSTQSDWAAPTVHATSSSSDLREQINGSTPGSSNRDVVLEQEEWETAMVSEEPQPLPVNLIEFPRELVATRRARPRLVEGPLCESPEQAAIEHPQLTIFEVERESISKTAEAEPDSTDWAPIHLDSRPASPKMEENPVAPAEIHIQAAPIEDRAIAWIVDSTLVLFAFVFFVFVAAASNATLPTGKSALLAGGFLIAGIYLLYQYLFFKFADGTPGMRYAKIALCTFGDEQPTRKQMRRRILYLLFSAAPLGLGYLWTWFDANRLSWHDRLTRMYLRSYQ